MNQKKILVAATPEGQFAAQRALSAHYQLQFASTLREAQSLLAESEIHIPEKRSSFDLVMCGVHFDDSRMFELLSHVRDFDHYEKLPFLVIVAKQISRPLDNSVRHGAEMLGAYGFVQLQDLSPSEADDQLRAAVLEGFSRPVQTERLDPKNLQKTSGES